MVWVSHSPSTSARKCREEALQTESVVVTSIAMLSSLKSLDG